MCLLGRARESLVVALFSEARILRRQILTRSKGLLDPVVLFDLAFELIRRVADKGLHAPPVLVPEFLAPAL